MKRPGYLANLFLLASTFEDKELSRTHFSSKVFSVISDYYGNPSLTLDSTIKSSQMINPSELRSGDIVLDSGIVKGFILGKFDKIIFGHLQDKDILTVNQLTETNLGPSVRIWREAGT